MSNSSVDYSAGICEVLDDIALHSAGKTLKAFSRLSPITAGFISQLFVLMPTSEIFNASFERMTEYAFSILGFPKVSRQALAFRITDTMVSFMENVFSRAITSVGTKEEVVKSFHNSLNIKGILRIRVADCTIIQLPDSMKEFFPGTGGHGKASKSSLKIFHEFDLLSTFSKFAMAAGKTADVTFNVIEDILKGDLLLRDQGFRDLAFFAMVRHIGAFFIQRLYCTTVIFMLDAQGKVAQNHINIEELAIRYLNNKKNKGATYLSFNVQLGTKKETRESLGPVRLIAMRISDKSANKKVENAKREAKRNGKTLSKAKEILCHWHICFTNLTEEQATKEQVVEIYRLRWQIELRFKSWKSTLRIDTVTVQSANRLKCAILGYFTKMLLLGNIFTDAKLRAEEQEIALFEQQKATNEEQSTTSKSPKEKADTISDAKLFSMMAFFHHKIVEAFVQSRQKLKQCLDQILDNLMKKAKKDVKKTRICKKEGD
jgi:hypothetical protein